MEQRWAPGSVGAPPAPPQQRYGTHVAMILARVYGKPAIADGYTRRVSWCLGMMDGRSHGALSPVLLLIASCERVWHIGLCSRAYGDVVGSRAVGRHGRHANGPCTAYASTWRDL